MTTEHGFFFSWLLFSAKSRFWTVVLVSPQATKWILYWSVSRRPRDEEGGGQIQAMLLKKGLGFGWGQRARGRKASTLLWEKMSSHNKLFARVVKVAWARRADHLAMRAAVTAWRKGCWLWRALALAAPRFNSKSDEAAATWIDKFRVCPFLRRSRIP